jgi:hypothetical protein
MYSWNQKGAAVAARTSSSEQRPTVERQNGTPADSAARAACTSPRLRIRPASPTGASTTGIDAWRMAISALVSMHDTSRSTRCLSWNRAKSSRFDAIVRSSTAPPSM